MNEQDKFATVSPEGESVVADLAKHRIGGESVAALFQAPENPGEAAAEASDPLNELDEVQKEMVRLRAMPVSDLVLEYLGVRDHLDGERHKWQALETSLKDRLTRMSMVMREKGDDMGVDNFTVRGVGTAYRNIKHSYRVLDWDGYWKWLVENGYSQCVEKRPAKLAVQEIHRATGVLPPGLDHIQEVEFLVRRIKQ